jgi:putative iron-dependent peroxidase
VNVPQFGIFAQGTIAHHFVEFDLRTGVSTDQVAASLRQLREPAVSAGGVNLVAGFGSNLWRALAPGQVPSRLHSFEGLIGSGGHRVPATQHDLWLWIDGSSADVVFEHMRAAAAAISDVAKVAAEQPCFVHRDSRDLTGFIDGTANPQQHEAASVALVPDGEPGAGGSHVLAIRWVHDLDAFHSLPIEEQQRVFGRTKPDSVELEGEQKPATAHIARVEIEDAAGQELEIYRRGVPYGSLGEHGLYFVAFAADPQRFEIMLGRMFGAADDGLNDRLMEFTRPVSGALYFAPSLTALSELAAVASS